MVWSMQTVSKDLRPERFNEYLVGAQRIGRQCALMFFGGMGGALVIIYGLKGHLPERHWFWGAMNLGLICFLVGLVACAIWAQRRLAQRLNVVCKKCRHVPLPGKLRRTLKSRACPKCGAKYEVETN